MNGYLRAFIFFLLVIFGLCSIFYLHIKWQRIENHTVIIMRSSNEDCDEFRCIWTIDRVLQGKLTAEEASASCYLINSKREYSKRDSVEWIKVEGGFTHENGQDFYADCTGVLVFQDKTANPIVADKDKQHVATARRHNK